MGSAKEAMNANQINSGVTDLKGDGPGDGVSDMGDEL